MAGMTPTCLNARSTTPGHAFANPTDYPESDILPDLNQSIGELLDYPQWVWKPPNALIHDVPRYSMGFMSGERAGQSIVSMPSSSKNSWHTLAT